MGQSKIKINFAIPHFKLENNDFSIFFFFFFRNATTYLYTIQCIQFQSIHQMNGCKSLSRDLHPFICWMDGLM